MATLDYGDPTVIDFTLDETENLQNSVATAGVPGDDDDEDIARADATAAFSTLLTSLEVFDVGFNGYANDGRIARSSTDLFTVDGDVTNISLAGEYDPVTMTAEPLLSFSDGGLATAGGATGLTTTAGEAIYLFGDYNGTAGLLAGNVAFGVDASGDLAFVIRMIETPQADGTVDLQFEMATAQAIDHPDDGDPDDAIDLGDFLSIQVDESSGFNFIGVPPGKSLHLTAAANSGTGGVIVTGLVEEVQVNTSNAFPDGVIGYGSQGINAGESVVMTWVADGLIAGLTIPELDQNEADLATNVRFGTLDSVLGASFKIQQKVGSKVATLTVTALQANTEDGTGSGDFFDDVGNGDVGGAGDDTTIAIDTITLIRGGTEYELSASGSFGGTGVTATFLASGQVAIGGTGVLAGDEIAYTTLTPTERLVVTGASGNFDIGGFSTTQTGSTAFAIGEAFVMEDDGPVVDVTVATDVNDALENLARNLDETIGAPDALATGEPPDFNSDADDVVGGGAVWAEAPALAMGSLTTDDGQLAALFADADDFVDYGTDGAGDLGGGESRTDALSFELTGTEPVETTLIATPVVDSELAGVDEEFRTVYLTVNPAGTIVEGRVMGPDGDWGGGDDYLIVRMTLNNADIPGDATITYEQFAPVQNPLNTLYDEEVGLTTANVGEYLSVVWDTSAADGDDDTASDTASVQLINNTDTVFTIDDDGPRTNAGPAPIPLWEDGLIALGGLTDDDGEDEFVAGSINLSSQVVAGSDGIKAFGFDSDFDDVLDELGLTSGGTDVDHEITYNGATGIYTLLATAGVGGAEVYRVTINETTGLATATLSGTLDHAQGLVGQNEEDEILIDLTGGLFAIEGDDDPASFLPNALGLLIEDDALEIDIPDSGAGYNISMDYAATPDGTLTGFLDVGADGGGSPYFVAGGFTTALLTGDPVFGNVTGALDADGDLVYTSSVYGEIIEISVSDADDGTIVVDVLADAPLVEVPLIDGATTPGGPIDTFGLPIANPIVTLDGFFFTDAAADGKASFGTGDLGIADPGDDVNISNKGAAVFDNQFDQGEGLALFFDDDVAGVTFEVQGGTGSKESMTVYVTAYDGGEFVATYSETFNLPKGNGFELVEFMPEEDFDELYITHSLSAPNGFRIPEIFAFNYADIPDMEGVVTVGAADGDLDLVTDTFDFLISGDTIA